MVDVPETDDEALATRPTIYAADAYAGRTVLISGGAGGLGRACAWLLGRLGARIVLTGRNVEKLEAAAGAMQGKGLDAQWREVDIRDPDSVAALYAWLAAQDLKIDALVNSVRKELSPRPPRRELTGAT